MFNEAAVYKPHTRRDNESYKIYRIVYVIRVKNKRADKFSTKLVNARRATTQLVTTRYSAHGGILFGNFLNTERGHSPRISAALSNLNTLVTLSYRAKISFEKRFRANKMKRVSDSRCKFPYAIFLVVEIGSASDAHTSDFTKADT